MSELLKCPFCGRRSELRHDKDGFSYIVCANDGCYVRTDGHLNEESAIKHWNTRKPMDNIVEKLKELKMRYFLTIANTGDDKNDFAYENVGNALDNAINIIKQEINNGENNT